MVLDSAEEEVPSELGLESAPFTGPRPNEKLQFWPCAMSKWLNIDINMLLKTAVSGILLRLLLLLFLRRWKDGI